MKKIFSLALFFCLSATFMHTAAQDIPDKRMRRQLKFREFRRDLDRSLHRSFKELDLALEEIHVNTRDLEIEFKNLGKDLEDAFRGFGKDIDNRNNSCCDSADNQNCNENLNFNSEKSKKINKTFSLPAGKKLDIENRFGKVHINTWDKNEATVDINVIARGGSDAKAQEILDKISVDFNEDASTAYCKTNIASLNMNGNKNFEINYTINMPRNNPLRVYNKFGDVYLGSFNGKTELEVAYGNLKTEQLNHLENNIRVSFGGGYIPYAKNCKINVSYADSGFRLGTSESVDMTCSYSKMEIENAGTLLLKSKYCELEIGTAGSIQGTAGYTNFTVRKLSSALNIEARYCGDFEVKSIARTFKSINVANSFSTLELGFSPESNFNFEVGVNFCDLTMDKSNTQFSHIDKQNNSASYKGKYGKSSSTGTVFIQSKYGDVRVSLRE